MTPRCGCLRECRNCESGYHNDLTGWFLARLVCARVTATAPDTRPGQSGNRTAVRTSGFDYSTTTGLLTKEVIEPESGDLTELGGVPDCVTAETDATARHRMKLVTTYTHDGFGNVSAVTVTGDHDGDTGTAALSRTTETTWGERSVDWSTSPSSEGTVTANGRFPVEVENALGHVERRRFDARFGALDQMKGPNGLVTTWGHDGFGRKVLEVRADGNETAWTYALCSEITCPEGVYAVTEAPDGGAQKTVYLDLLNRETRAETEGFDASVIIVDTTFDALGRIATRTAPYFSGATATFSTATTYDLTGRPIRVEAPDGSETVIVYDGLVTTTKVSADGEVGGGTKPDLVSVKTLNAIGQTVETTDPLSTSTTFAYDASGNLLETAVNASATHTVLIGYDRRGRKDARWRWTIPTWARGATSTTPSGNSSPRPTPRGR